MKGTDFNLATSIFFVGYLTMQLPSNLLITRLRPSIYLGTVVAVWGVVATCNSAVHSFDQLLAVRICLGIAEAPFFPGAIFLLSSWYTRAELAYRIAWFYSGNALANMFGGLLAAAVLDNLDGDHGLAGWRWLFIIEGTITIGVGILATLVLPNYPATTKWLNEEEQAYAQWRLVDDAKESDDQKSITLWQGVKLAFRDYRLYLFILLQHTSILSQTFQYFFPSIVKTLGYGKIVTLLLTVPVWFATFLTSLLCTWTAGRTGDRSIHIICLMLVSCIGNAIATGATSTGPRFFAMFLMPMGAIPAYTIIVAWVGNSFIRPLVKRGACIAVANAIGNCASVSLHHPWIGITGSRRSSTRDQRLGSDETVASAARIPISQNSRLCLDRVKLIENVRSMVPTCTPKVTHHSTQPVAVPTLQSVSLLHSWP